MALSRRFPVLVLAGVFAVLAAPSAATAWAWVGLCVVIAGVDLLLSADPRAVSFARGPASQVRLGEAASTTLYLTNGSKRHLRGVVRDAWLPSAGSSGERHTVDVPVGERRAVTTGLRPVRRGDRPADHVTVRAFGPLGVAARQRSVSVPGVVRALPPFHSRKHLPSRLAVLRQIDGRSAVRIRGAGTEFDSLRDYVDGDDVRSIDWRATARRRAPVVRTWQPERDRRVVLVLDTSRLSAGRVLDMPRLDASMDAALLLAALASRAGDRVDLVAGDRRVRARVSGVDRTRLLAELVTAMAPLEPTLVEADWTRLAAGVAQVTRRRALVVLLTTVEPVVVEETLLPTLAALTRHHRVVIASVADPTVAAMAATRSSTREVYDAAAAERSQASKDRVVEALGRLGVTVVDAPPEQLPPLLADHYLMLKSRGLL